MQNNPVVLLALYATFLFSTVLHEAAHSWVALRGGDETAQRGGQVSLDPLPHIRREIFGMVVLPLLFLATIGFPLGYASAPYNAAWAREFPKRAALMAAAGPLSNLLLCLLAGIALRLSLELGFFALPERWGWYELVVAADPLARLAAILLSATFTLNLLLCLFNLLPLPPLDGSGILPAFLPDAARIQYEKAINHPILSLMGLFVAWRFFPLIFDPAMSVALKLIYS